jgi:hypothetical protein
MSNEKVSITATLSKYSASLINQLYNECVKNGSYEGPIEEYYGAYIENELGTIIKLHHQINGD